MAQYNMHNELNEFYDKHVRLKDEISRLRELRDTNLSRLSEGLKALNKPDFIKSLEQGSIAMHTANKAPDNDYDIDLAIIFEKDDLPASPLEARKRVAAAINEKAAGFSKEPEARTNAVTVWYADGYHVDLAIYRRQEDFWGNEILEHAGPEWTKRDPKAITNWFIKEVKEQSPSETLWSTPEVEVRQMRRIVRWIKCFAKGREGWNLPGGLIASILVAECYRPDDTRDDVALYNTLVAIKNRLNISCRVYNPTEQSQELTEKQKFLTQVKNLKKRLGSVITKLDKLFEDKCTEKMAKKAWHYMFQHEFWDTENQANLSKSTRSLNGYTIDLRMGIAKKQHGPLTANNVVNGRFLPKKVHLKFSASTNVPSPYTVKWEVRNSGDEAEAANDMGHVSTSGQLTKWEQTAYRGKHKMVCEIIKNGNCVAAAEKIVNIR